MKPTPAESARFTAGVLRAEAEVRRRSPLAHQQAFSVVLDTWAANAERRADEAERDQQPDLFA